jgi:hypothetical protein
VRPGAIVTRWRDIVGLGLVHEHDARRPHRELVAIVQIMVGDPLAPHERAVQRPQVAQQVAPIGRSLDLRVLLRDDPIEDLDRVVGMPADRVESSELELLPLVPGDNDQLCHRRLEVPLNDSRSSRTNE